MATATAVLVKEKEEETTPTMLHNVTTVLNYYNDPGDGSPPAPVIIGGYVCLLALTT